MTFDLIMRGVAVAAAAFVLWRVRGRISVTHYPYPSQLIDHVVAVGYLVGAHLLISWAVGPWAAAGAVIIGLILATEPWDLLRAPSRSGAASPAMHDKQTEADSDAGASAPAEPEMAGGGTREMTPEEREAWDDLVRRLN